MAASRGSANRPPRICWVPVEGRSAFPVGFRARRIMSEQILGGRFALPRDAAMTKLFLCVTRP